MALTKVTNDLQDALAAAQPTITSVGTLTNFTSTGIDDNATSTAITIDASENVGIGTSSPIGKMQVSGTNNGDVLYITSSDVEDDRGLMFSNSSNGLIWGLDAKGASSAFGQLTFSTNGTERMRIESNGSVGVGIANPSAYYADFRNLVLGNTSANSGMTIVSSTSSSGTIAFSDGTSGSDAYKGYIQYNHATDALMLGSLATERMVIDSGGRVTMPYQPSFQTAGTNYTQGASGVYSKIVPASEMHDTGNNFSSGTFTAPIAGTYEFAFWGLLYPFTTSQNSTMVYRKNNANISQGIQGGGNATSHQAMSGSIILVLALGDYVDLWLQVSGGRAYSGQWHMSGKLIG